MRPVKVIVNNETKYKEDPRRYDNGWSNDYPWLAPSTQDVILYNAIWDHPKHLFIWSKIVKPTILESNMAVKLAPLIGCRELHKLLRDLK